MRCTAVLCAGVCEPGLCVPRACSLQSFTKLALRLCELLFGNEDDDRASTFDVDADGEDDEETDSNAEDSSQGSTRAHV